MKLKTKLLLPITAVGSLVVLSPVALAAACSTGNSSATGFDSLSKNQEGGININAAFSVSAQPTDRSRNYGPFLDRPEDSTVAKLVRIKTIYQPIVESDATSIGEVSFKIKQPSVTKYRLELAKKVIVTTRSNGVKVFDSDDIKDYAKLWKISPYTGKKLSIKGKSDNPKSINSQAFQDALNDATKIQYEIRDNVYWSNAKGEKTKYKVVPKDFYISWLRTQSLNKSWRLKKLGTQEDKISESVKKILPDSSLIFGDENYPNGYLFDLYGLNKSKLDDEDGFLQDYNDGDETFKVVTIEALPNKQSNSVLFSEYFDNDAHSYLLAPAPSQFIEEHLQEPKLYAFSNKSLLSDAKSKISELESTNPLAFSGAYWYGFNSESTLYAGAYYYEGYDLGTGSEFYSLNPNYWDNSLTSRDNKTVIRRYQVRYMNNTDSSQFQKQTFSDYLNGSVTRVAVTSLNENDRTTALNDPKKYGVSYLQSLNKNQLKRKITTLAFPTSVSKQYAHTIDAMLYNDAFARFAFGVPLQEIFDGAKTQNFKGVNFYKESLAGRYQSFKSIISTAINWRQFAEFVTAGKGRQWISGAPIDGLLGASDSGSDTMIDYYDDLNKLFAVDANMVKLGETTFESNNPTGASTTDKFKSSIYTDLQKAMKKLIDDYNKNLGTDVEKISETNKLKLTLTNRYTNWSPSTMEQAFSEMKKVLNGLDSRLDIDLVKYDGDTQLSKLYGALTGGTSIQRFFGWSNDVNNLGSTIDGMLTGGSYKASLGIIGSNTEISDALKTNYPELVKAAKAFVQYTKDPSNEFEIGVPVEKWINVPSSILDELVSDDTYFKEHKWDNNKNEVVESDSVGTDLATITSKFWVQYVRNLNKTDSINLYQQVYNYMGLLFDPDKTTSLNSFSPRLVNPNYAIPFSGDYSSFIQDIVISGNANDKNTNV